MPTKTTTGVTLQDPRLFRQACYIDGAWIETSAEGVNNVIEVDNPATGEIVGTVPITSPVAGLSTSIVSRAVTQAPST